MIAPTVCPSIKFYGAPVQAPPLGCTSFVGCLLKAPVRAEIGSGFQFARYSDGKALLIGQIVRSVYRKTDREIGGSCVAMGHLGAFGDRPIAEVPVIAECRWAA